MRLDSRSTGVVKRMCTGDSRELGDLSMDANVVLAATRTTFLVEGEGGEEGNAAGVSAAAATGVSENDVCLDGWVGLVIQLSNEVRERASLYATS